MHIKYNTPQYKCISNILHFYDENTCTSKHLPHAGRARQAKVLSFIKCEVACLSSNLFAIYNYSALSIAKYRCFSYSAVHKLCNIINNYYQYCYKFHVWFHNFIIWFVEAEFIVLINQIERGPS